MSSYEERFRALVEQRKVEFSRQLEAADAEGAGQAAPSLDTVNALTSDTRADSFTLKVKQDVPNKTETLPAIGSRKNPFLSSLSQTPSALNVQHPLSDVRSSILPQPRPSTTKAPPSTASVREKSPQYHREISQSLNTLSVSTLKPQSKVPLRPNSLYNETTGTVKIEAPLAKPLGSTPTNRNTKQGDDALRLTSSRPQVETRDVPRIPLAPPSKKKHSLSPESKAQTSSSAPPSKKVKPVAPLSGPIPSLQPSTGSTDNQKSLDSTQLKNIKVTRPHAPPRYERPADAPSRPSPTPGRVLPTPAKDLYPGVTARDAQRVNSHYKEKMSRSNMQFQDLSNAYQNRPEKVEQFEERVNKTLQELQFCDFITLPLLRATNFLGAGRGFNILFESADMNPNLIADAQALQHKWAQEDFDPYLLRGIDYIERSLNGKTRKNPKLSPEWKLPVKHPYYEGHGNLTNGQWWPMQICAKRDGAHRELEAGISGDSKNGADSIVLSDAGYSDNDNGTNIVYCGTSGKDGEATSATKLLLISHHANKSIRVLRSSKLKSKYAPSAGIRYDGLYKIVAFVVIDQDTAMHQFRLQRVEGQDPIRFEGKFVRPNALERREWEKIKSLIGSREA